MKSNDFISEVSSKVVGFMFHDGCIVFDEPHLPSLFLEFTCRVYLYMKQKVMGWDSCGFHVGVVFLMNHTGKYFDALPIFVLVILYMCFFEMCCLFGFK